MFMCSFVCMLWSVLKNNIDNNINSVFITITNLLGFLCEVSAWWYALQWYSTDTGVHPCWQRLVVDVIPAARSVHEHQKMSAIGTNHLAALSFVQVKKDLQQTGFFTLQDSRFNTIGQRQQWRSDQSQQSTYSLSKWHKTSNKVSIPPVYSTSLEGFLKRSCLMEC